jgi:hypothetical protein
VYDAEEGAHLLGASLNRQTVALVLQAHPRQSF